MLIKTHKKPLNPRITTSLRVFISKINLTYDLGVILRLPSQFDTEDRHRITRIPHESIPFKIIRDSKRFRVTIPSEPLCLDRIQSRRF